jgi:lysophospholipase L1-like esterase
MKAYKILFFFILIIACLAFIAAFFPIDGISLFHKTLRFPSLTEILTQSHTETEDADPEVIIKQWEIKPIVIKEDTISIPVKKINRQDTIKYIENAFEEIVSTFELPGGKLTYFDIFFEKAEAARSQYRIVRVLYYGDSQIEMDRFSNNLRQFFQKKFGGGGPGMVPFHQTIATDGLSQNYSGEYSCFSLWGETRRNKEGDYGPLAKMFRINGHNTFSANTLNRKGILDRRDNYSNISLLVNDLKGGFTAELSDKTNQTKYRIETDTTGIHLLDFHINFATQAFSITMNGYANIYGILIDDGFGIAVDNIAMRGAGGLHFSSMNDSLMRETFHLLDVGMIILQFGGNAVPGLSGEKSVDLYVANIVSQIKYIQRIMPRIPILFIGPSDMLSVVDGELKTYKHLPYLVEKLSIEIPKSGAAFWNMYQVMGGANSMRAWVRKGWAGNDYVHFTAKGAQEIANILTRTFEAMYEYYELRNEE